MKEREREQLTRGKRRGRRRRSSRYKRAAGESTHARNIIEKRIASSGNEPYLSFPSPADFFCPRNQQPIRAPMALGVTYRRFPSVPADKSRDLVDPYGMVIVYGVY